jgi:hypothetical protein
MKVLRRMKKAEMIRTAGYILGSWSSNKQIQRYIYDSTKEVDNNGVIINDGVRVSVQQVAQVLGRYAERRLDSANSLRLICREFLSACGNDCRLARRIIREYEAVL